MVHIKLSVVFILAAAAFTPVVPLPIPAKSKFKRVYSQDPDELRRIEEVRHSLLKLSNLDEPRYNRVLPNHPEVQRLRNYLSTLSTKDAEDQSASLPHEPTRPASDLPVDPIVTNRPPPQADHSEPTRPAGDLPVEPIVTNRPPLQAGHSRPSTRRASGLPVNPVVADRSPPQAGHSDPTRRASGLPVDPIVTNRPPPTAGHSDKPEHWTRKVMRYIRNRKQKPALGQQGSDKGKGTVDLAHETYHTRADSESGSGAAGHQ